MNAPVTWQLIELIQSRLQQITVANGYHTDIGANALIEDTQADAVLETPYCIVDVSKTALSRSPDAPLRQRTLTFQIEAGVQATQDNAKLKAHQVLADIERAMSISQTVPLAGVRFAQATDSEILKRPDGLDAIVVSVTGAAHYLPS